MEKQNEPSVIGVPAKCPKCGTINYYGVPRPRYQKCEETVLVTCMDEEIDCGNKFVIVAKLTVQTESFPVMWDKYGSLTP